MIKEELIYISEDNVEFNDKESAEMYDEYYAKFKTLLQNTIGEETLKRNLFELCLETKTHKREHLLEILEKTYELCFEKITFNDNCNFKNLFLEDLNKLKSATDKMQNFYFNRSVDDLLKLYNGFIRTFKLRAETVFYDKSIFCKHLIRLYNISYISGIEYPASKWVNNEDKWKAYVESEYKMKKLGNKYR